jgi:hypothetical protein
MSLKFISRATSSRKSGIPIFRFLGLFVFLFHVACQPSPRFTVERLPGYEALFQHSAGWIGADGAYSVALGGHRIMWLFGDTLVGEIKEGRRIIAGMVPNSIAIQISPEHQAASIEFFPDGGSEPFLTPGEGFHWFWPNHAVRTPEGLYFFLLQLERADIPPPFGFRLVSTWLGHVRNPEDPPQRWIFSHLKIPWANAQRQLLHLRHRCRTGKEGYSPEHDSGAGADRQTRRFRLLAFLPGRRMDYGC